MTTRAGVKVHEGWITLTEAADILRVTRQAVHKMAFPARLKDETDSEFAARWSARRLKTVEALGDKPLFIVRRAEVLNERRRMDEEESRQTDAAMAAAARSDK